MKLPGHLHGKIAQPWPAGKDDRTVVLMAIDSEHNVEHIVVHDNSDLSAEEIGEALKDYYDMYHTGDPVPTEVVIYYGMFDIETLEKHQREQMKAIQLMLKHEHGEG